MANTGVMIHFGGRERRLRFDVNSICDFEQVSGVTVQQLAYRSGVHVTRALLWAGLKHEQPDLTLMKVGEYLQDFSDEHGGAFAAGQTLGDKIQDALVMAGILAAEKPDDEDADGAEGGDAGEALATAG